MKDRQGLVNLLKKGINEVEVTAKIVEFSTTVARNNQIVPTMLLVNIRDAATNCQLAEHSWVIVRYNTGETLAKGKTIRFIANIERYGNKVGIGYQRKT
jgi:hypothetical protein